METMRKTHEDTKKALDHAVEDMKRFYDWKPRSGVEYSIGDLVLLEATNICRAAKVQFRTQGSNLNL